MFKFSIVPRFLVFLSVVCLPPGVTARESYRLSRSEAVARTLAENASLVAARSLIAQAEARGTLAGRLDNPELTVEYSSDLAFNNEGESVFGIGFAQKFPVTKRISLLKGIADLEIELAKAEVRNVERLLVRDVEQLCNDLAYFESELGLRRSMVEIDQRFEAFVESRIEAAEASPVDANQIRIELYALQQEIAELEIARAKAIAELKSHLNLEASVSLETTHRFDENPSEPQLSEFGVGNLDTHPEYRMRSLLLEAADKQTSLARASRWDDFSIGLLFEDERSVDEPVGLGNNQFFGVSVSIPLPLRDRSRGLLQESLSVKAQREAELAAASLSLRNKAAALQEEAMSRFRQASHYQKNITMLVEQNLAEMSDAYSSGQVSLSELFRSQSQALKIRSAQLSMARDYEQALVNWKAATARNL